MVTPAGRLYGGLLEVAGSRQVRQFLGIPYAEPPTGQLRFKVQVRNIGPASASNATNPTNQAARLAIGFSFLLFPCFLLRVSRVQCEQYRLYNTAGAATIVVYIRCALQQTWLPLFQKVANRPLVM